MSASTSKGAFVYGKNRAKSRGSLGWAAFDRNQRQKQQGLEPEIDTEAYPALSGSKHAQILSNKNGTPLEMSFSSLMVAPINFPSVMDKDLQMRVPFGNSGSDTANKTGTEAAVPSEIYQKLNSLHPWADQSLIQDLLAGVNNNTQEALSLLEAMLVTDDRESTNINSDSSYGNDAASLNITDDCFKHGFVDSGTETSSGMLRDAATKSLPVEPESEWEVDDVYLIHRKDAIRVMRSASRHSKAATDAYVRGDHLSAHSLSLKAQEEWSAAEKLNAEAAKNILTLRNQNNDMWTLDLHGLHAAEAVEALQERLLGIESLLTSGCLATPSRDDQKPNILHSASLQSTSLPKTEKFCGRPPSSMRGPRLLQAITGKGSHSRGAAALPSAIRNFLSENGYRFDETRPGVVMIRPKFRQQ